MFGVPLVAFGLQAALVRDIEYGAALERARAGRVLPRAREPCCTRAGATRCGCWSNRFLALGVGFATLAIPLALDGRWTSAAWALEGAAIVWVGVRQERMLARCFGLLLQLAAGFAFLAVDRSRLIGATPVLNSLYLGCVMLSVAGLFCSRYLDRRRAGASAKPSVIAARLLFVWGALWWFGGGLVEIHRHAPDGMGLARRICSSLPARAPRSAWLWRRLDWDMARYAALAILPLMAVIVARGSCDRPSRTAIRSRITAYLGWPLAFARALVAAARARGRATSRWIDWLHAAGFWLLAVVAVVGSGLADRSIRRGRSGMAADRRGRSCPAR